MTTRLQSVDEAFVADLPQPADDGTFTAIELCQQAGITYRQCDYWTTTGRLQAVPYTHGKVVRLAPARARYIGFSKRYPASEVRIATLMRRLLDAGLDVWHAHDAARALDDGTVRLGPGLVLLVEEDP